MAAAVLEEEGPDALTMRELAARMGIRAPSLYKHVRDKDDIVAGVQERALIDLAHHLAAADRPWAGRTRGGLPVLGQGAPPALRGGDPAPAGAGADRAGRRVGGGRPSSPQPGAMSTWPEPCGRSRTGWSTSSSPTGSLPAPTSTPPGGRP